MRIWIGISEVTDASLYEVDIRLGSDSGRHLASHSMVRFAEEPWVAPEGFEGQAPGALAEAARSVTSGEKEKDVVARLGGHLFQSLLGSGAWGEVKRTVREGGQRKVELALSLPPGVAGLHQPPWEAMHDGSEFLAAHSQLTVAITRVLAPGDADDEAAPVLSLPAPARVLFVIGAEEGDPDIRAGMEVLGVLRGAERGPAGIDAQILQSASVETLDEACERFAPHIVHFVSHGRVSESERGELSLRDGDRKDWVNGERLLSAICTADGHTPTVAVLTGCRSAAAGCHVDSLAAELASGGIPVVLGMSGRISDRVCRLFVRRFGVALSQGEPLVDALTSGRRAGLQQQVEAAADDPAWALPSIYLHAGVDSSHALVDIDNPSPVVARVKEYQLDLEPVFCGRLEHVERFDELLDMRKELNNLVVYTGRNDAQLGKSRLLHEFAGRALRRGNLVVSIDDPGEDISRQPRSIAKLAIEALTAIHFARERFRLDVPDESRLVSVLSATTGFELDLSGEVALNVRRDLLGAFAHRCKRKANEIDDQAFAGALPGILADDLTQLAVEARTAHPETFGPAQRVVAILGGIGKWGEVTDVLCQSLLGVYGLGTEAEPVPVFATASMADAPEPLERGLRKAETQDATCYLELRRLQGEEELLAYKTVLLHPSRLRLGHRPPLPPYVPNFEKKVGRTWDDLMRDYLEGIPGHFRERLLLVAPLLAESEVLLAADEEDIMKGYLKEEGHH